jgi:predicted DNA repair protein MutK
MFLVGGGILTHALPALHDIGGDGILGGLIKLLVDGGTGVVAGALVLAGVRLVHPFVSRSLQRLKGSPAD